MKKYDLEKIEKQLIEKTMEDKAAVNYVAEILLKCPALFGLQIYDEDFRSEVIVNFLEKGNKIIRNFNSEQGTLFTYLYYNITSIVNCLIKSWAKNKLQNHCLLRQCIDEYDDHVFSYSTLNFKEIENPGIPFSVKKVDYRDLRKAFKNDYSTKLEKALIVLFIKFPNYLPESTIRDICKKTGINMNLLLDALEESKSIINHNLERNSKMINSRNKSYYFHNRYQTQIDSIKNDYNSDKKLKLGETIHKYETHTRMWKNKNKILMRKFTRINTSNKVIANILGISERQVRYYIECFHNEKFLTKLKNDILKDIN